MTVPAKDFGNQGFRLGLWVVILGTLIGLAVWAPVLTFGMPGIRIFLWTLAVALPFGAIYSLRQGRLERALGIIAPGALIVIGPLMAFLSLVAHAASQELFLWTCIADALCLILLWVYARRKGPGLWIALPLLWVAVHMVAASSVLYQLYRLPAAGYCEALAEDEAVFRASKGHGAGLAHASLFFGDSTHVAATFKVDRDMLLAGLGEGEGNSIAVFPLSTLKEGGQAIPSPVKLEEGEMPQFMLYDSKERLVFTLTSAIDGKHRLGIVERPTESPFKVDHWIPLPNTFEPNAILEDEGHYIVFALHAEVLKVNMETRELVDHWVRTDSDWLKGRVVLSMRPGFEGKTYLATLGFNVVEHNIRTRENRKLRIPWGGAGGVLRLLESKGEIVVTDMVFHNLIFIDRETLEIKRVKELDFGPRALAWDPEREILYVGEYIEGRVHAFNYSDLSSAGPSLELGENLRSFSYDPRSRSFLASSKCGLMGVDVYQAFGESPP